MSVVTYLKQAPKLILKASVVGGIFYATYKNEVWNFDNGATVDRCNYLASHPHMPFHPSLNFLPSKQSISSTWNSGVTKVFDAVVEAPTSVKNFVTPKQE